MSRILDLQEKLQDTSAAIAEFERAVAHEPDSVSLAAMLKSFAKRKQQLEDDFRSTAADIGTDVCRYRFFSDSRRPTVSPLCAALAEFQSLFSVAYDAVKNGPKRQSRKLPPEVVDQSSFYFGYSFSGSVGIVMTFDNNVRSLFESSLDEAMLAIVDIAQARASDEIISKGKRLGVPGVRALHRWAARHVEAAMGAEIEWQKGHETKARLLAQLPDLRQLVSAIDNATEIIEEESDEIGRLAGADVTKRTFHLELADQHDIRGSFAETISPTQTFEVGRRYQVTLRRRIKVFYSTDVEEDVSFQLIAASPIVDGQ
ncbi:MAG TPA: hypothetical protein VMV10_24540 [Pirellulales bacterium]|nr:hypothetical protein [Pirellulales bacterium]